MVGLGLHPFGGRLSERSDLLYRLMVLLHAPPSFIECGYLVKGQTRVAVHQVQVGRSVPVFEDLPCQRQRTVKALEPYRHRDLPQIERLDIYPVPVSYTHLTLPTIYSV